MDGLVVNMLDQRVWKPTPRYLSYTMSKAALLAATKTMAQALAPHIRVNAIGPGPSLRNEGQTDAQFAEVVDAVLLGRGPALSEFGATIRYLWQTRSITGQMIALDGGQHLAWQTRTRPERASERLHRADDMPVVDLDDDDVPDEPSLPAGPEPSFIAIDWSAHASGADGLAGAEVIQTLVKRLPNQPGVYRMLNAAGDVLYVGKARSLSACRNMRKAGFHTNRIGRMVRETSTMEFVVRPHGNRAASARSQPDQALAAPIQRLDAGRQIVSLHLDHRRSRRAEHLQAHRGARSRKGDYFGPFASAQAVGRTIQLPPAGVPDPELPGFVFENRTRPTSCSRSSAVLAPFTGEIRRVTRIW